MARELANYFRQAAGITSLIKALLMFQKSRIPPHAGIQTTLNQKIEYINELNIRIPRSNMPFESRSGQERRRIMVNNFNATVRHINGTIISII